MNLRLTMNLVTIGLVMLLLAPAAHAQATRTWVSGVGDDANPCSRTAPCKTFAGAISKTAAGGEISVLDPGGFGTVTITKSITINGDGTLAAILAAGTSGVVINAAPTDKVILRNISINGFNTGLDGIRYLAGGTLTVENVTISGFNTAGTGRGISVQATAAAELLVATAKGFGFRATPDLSDTTRNGRRLARVGDGDELVSIVTVDIGPVIRRRAEAEASAFIDRPVRIGRLGVNIGRGRLVIEGLVVDGITQAHDPWLVAGRLELVKTLVSMTAPRVSRNSTTSVTAAGLMGLPVGSVGLRPTASPWRRAVVCPIWKPLISSAKGSATSFSAVLMTSASRLSNRCPVTSSRRASSLNGSISVSLAACSMSRSLSFMAK